MKNFFSRKDSRMPAEHFTRSIHTIPNEELERAVLTAPASQRPEVWRELVYKSSVSALDLDGQRVTGRLLFIPVNLIMTYEPDSLSIDADAVSRILQEGGVEAETIEVAGILLPDSQLRSTAWNVGHYLLLQALQNGLDGSLVTQDGYDPDMHIVYDSQGYAMLTAHICVLLTSTYPTVPRISLDEETKTKLRESLVFSLAQAEKETPSVFCGLPASMVEAARLHGTIEQISLFAGLVKSDCTVVVEQSGPQASLAGTGTMSSENGWVVNFVEGDGSLSFSLDVSILPAEEWHFFEMLKYVIETHGFAFQVQKKETH